MEPTEYRPSARKLSEPIPAPGPRVFASGPVSTMNAAGTNRIIEPRITPAHRVPQPVLIGGPRRSDLGQVSEPLN